MYLKSNRDLFINGNFINTRLHTFVTYFLKSKFFHSFWNFAIIFGFFLRDGTTNCYIFASALLNHIKKRSSTSLNSQGLTVWFLDRAQLHLQQFSLLFNSVANVLGGMLKYCAMYGFSFVGLSILFIIFLISKNSLGHFPFVCHQYNRLNSSCQSKPKSWQFWPSEKTSEIKKLTYELVLHFKLQNMTKTLKRK